MQAPFLFSRKIGCEPRDLRVAQRVDRVEVHAGPIERLQRVVSAFRPRKGGDRLLLQHPTNAADQAQVRLFRARQLLLRHRVDAQPPIGLSLVAQPLSGGDECKPA